LRGDSSFLNCLAPVGGKGPRANIVCRGVTQGPHVLKAFLAGICQWLSGIFIGNTVAVIVYTYVECLGGTVTELRPILFRLSCKIYARKVYILQIKHIALTAKHMHVRMVTGIALCFERQIFKKVLAI
jgi:hypothetical protein